MFNIQKFDSVGSTMDVARENLQENTIIQALEQTGGRGRHGNKWVSPIGNLYQSIILKPTQAKSDWGQISFVVSVALYEACTELNIENIQLKWPNDVLVNERKIAGILIEVSGDFVIIGTGVNVNHCPPDRAMINDFYDISVDDFRDIFLKWIAYYYSLWLENGFFEIRKKWLEHAYRLGEHIQARLPAIVYEGVFEGLDHNGILILREKDGYLRQINSGEILNVSGH